MRDLSFSSLLFLVFFGVTGAGRTVTAVELDVDLAESLKIEANHNLNRLNSYKNEKNNNKIYDNEREKALADFLEEQERWDLIRERGLSEYRRQKKISSPVDGGAEYKEDMKIKEADRKSYLRSQELHVNTRDRIRSINREKLFRLENEELQIYVERPRYDLRKRRRNKWAASAKPGSSGGGSSGFQNNVPPPNDFAPPPEFPPAPAPYEGFDDFPPPPPIYDGGNATPYDPSMGGGEMPIPPPPPPPPDFDF